MSAHHHDDHHSTEQKPVAFTVPFILAAVTILIVVLFLSLCDPKPHGEHHGVENKAHAKFEGDQSNHNSSEGKENAADNAATTTTKDSTGASNAGHSEAEHPEHH
jgi:hypothetical protein